VTIFVEGGINIPFNMTEREALNIFRKYQRPFFLRTRTLQLTTNDGQTRIALSWRRIVSIEANDEEYLRALNIKRQAEMQEKIKASQRLAAGQGPNNE
jgi:hypothetical protein